ncbi:MAG: fused MFS/spermidine synthase, partial [candidate division KSB1 bacterium]|nr:fused MFS/spermidine synthase [candidate division KSB1 bacterium]
MPLPVLFLLFFLSGFSALLYEIVWVRIFGLVFGNTTLATASVLGAFMLGMALGGLLIGSRSETFRNPLRVFAALELGGALAGLWVLFSRPILESLIVPAQRYCPGNCFIAVALKFGLAFFVMLPATLLMGGTLPVLGKAVAREKTRFGERLGILYGVNTLGGVLGCLLAGFFLIRWLGVSRSVGLGALVNLLVGLGAFALSSYGGGEAGATTRHGERRSLLDDPLTVQVLVIMAVSGFAALGYEVMWSRILVFTFTNSVYAFTVMLTTFLLGLAAGSLVGSIFVDRLQDLPRHLGWVEIGIGLSALLAAILLVNMNRVHQAIFMVGPSTTWFQLNAMRFVEAFLVMFLPTFLMGLSFPLAAKLIVHRQERAGKAVGTLYFSNTLGGMLGSVLTGVVLLRFWAGAAVVAALVFSNLAAGLWLLQYRHLGRSLRSSVLYLAAVLVVVVAILQLVPGRVFSGVYSLVEENFRIIDFREGIEGTVTVHKSTVPWREDRRLDVDGLNVAGTSFMLRTLQALQGHLPNLVHGPARKVLQIGFGTGQTSRSALMYPIDELTVVEISKDVVELAAKHFTDINRQVMRDPRFRCVISDGKNFVKYSSEKYDIIMNDANYAVETASASLFTRDHFLNCREKLNPGGIFSTWMTTDLDTHDLAIVLKTFSSVFPYGLLFMAPNCINKQVVLIGSLQPITLNAMWMEQQLGRDEIKADLAALNIHTLYDVLSCILLDTEGIRRLAEHAEVCTDDHPVLEFSTRAVRARDLCALQNLGRMLRLRPDLSRLSVVVRDSALFFPTLKRYDAASRGLFHGMLVFYRGDVQQALEILLSASRMIPESRLAEEYFRHMDAVVAELSYEAQQRPQELQPWLKLLRYRIAARQYEIALRTCQELVEKFGENPVLLYESARVHFALGQLD